MSSDKAEKGNGEEGREAAREGGRIKGGGRGGEERVEAEALRIKRESSLRSAAQL